MDYEYENGWTKGFICGGILGLVIITILLTIYFSLGAFDTTNSFVDIGKVRQQSYNEGVNQTYHLIVKGIQTWDQGTQLGINGIKYIPKDNNDLCISEGNFNSYFCLNETSWWGSWQDG